MKKLNYLKGLRTKLLNTKCSSMKQFEEIQEKLNVVELEIYQLEKEGNK